MDKFNSSFKGYNISEVNKFVDKTAKEYASMLDKLKSKDAEIFRLEQELEKYKNNQSNLGQTMLNSSNMNSDLVRMAREQAANIIDDAKKNASRIVNDALMDAERTEIKAENLRRNMIVFKRRMKSIIESQRQTLEDIEDVKLEN